jgi:hypothetical protein
MHFQFNDKKGVRFWHKLGHTTQFEHVNNMPAKMAIDLQ